MIDDERPDRPNFLGRTIGTKRFRASFWFLMMAVLTLLARVAYLQGARGEEYRLLSQENRVHTSIITPIRGIIFDRRGKILVKNSPSFSLNMLVSDLPTTEPERGNLLTRMADLAGLQRADLDLAITQQAREPNEAVPVKKGIPYETAMRLAVQIAAFPGFSLKTFEQRIYDFSASSLAHLLGYVGSISEAELAEPAFAGYRLVDQVGKTGLERGAEDLLRGRNGKVVIEVDALGQELAIVDRIDPTPGANLTLSIDLELQQFIQKRLEEVLKANRKTRASVVAIDPRTGGVRALISLPSYDNNQFATGIETAAYSQLIEDPDKPLFARATAGQFPAGSTFKPFVAYAALKEGVVTEKTSFLSVGGIRVGPWFFPDWRAGGHGMTDVRKALADSVNTFFYIVGGGYEQTTGLGVERITAYAKKFGFGEPTGLPLPGEASGFLPSKQWKEETKGERWYVGDTYNLSIGQGDLLVTPVQMAAAVATLANGGIKVRLRLIEAIDGTVATDILEPAPETATLDPYVVKIVREGMRQAVTRGSARLLSGLTFPVAGKTGTAQNIGNRPTHAWFIGFAPYQNPTLALTILIEEGGEGSTVAVPLAYDIFRWWHEREP